MCHTAHLKALLSSAKKFITWLCAKPSNPSRDMVRAYRASPKLAALGAVAKPMAPAKKPKAAKPPQTLTGNTTHAHLTH
jgi:hypothetical protein